MDSPCTLRSRRHRDRRGFTLPEVMIALLMVAMMCLAVFAGLDSISRLALGTAVRNEAHRLLQAEAERLSSVPFQNFVASSNQTITSNFRTTFLAGNQAQFSYPPSSQGRVTFTRRVVEVAASGTTRTLRIELDWTWQGRATTASLPMFRSQ